MTLQELYQNIDGNYDQAIRDLRMEKLMDKHIRKLTKNGVVDKLIEAGKEKDPVQLFECAHAVKGVCSNLGLTRLADAASEIAEEYRAGNSRKLSDEEINEKLQEIESVYKKTVEAIHQYENG